MPTTSNQKQASIPPVPEETDEVLPVEQAGTAHPQENTSEVSKRLSLLGKLIIPPPPTP